MKYSSECLQCLENVKGKVNTLSFNCERKIQGYEFRMQGNNTDEETD